MLERLLLATLGLIFILLGFFVLFVPASSTIGSVSEHSTTTSTAGGGGTTAAQTDKTTTTTTPGEQRSSTSVVVLLSIGAGLLLVASLWHQIQEFAIGGVTIKLRDEAVSPAAIPSAEVGEEAYAYPQITAWEVIANAVYDIANLKKKLVRVDLREGDRWGPSNLALFVLLLADRTSAEVLVFIEKDDIYVGAGSVSSLANRLASRDPSVAAARDAIRSSLDPPTPNKISNIFSEKLSATPNSWIQTRPHLVDVPGLLILADRALITDSVVSEAAQTLSTRQQRAILAFPLDFVPVTDHLKLDQVVDKARLAERIARSAVGL